MTQIEFRESILPNTSVFTAGMQTQQSNYKRTNSQTVKQSKNCTTLQQHKQQKQHATCMLPAIINEIQ